MTASTESVVGISPETKAAYDLERDIERRYPWVKKHEAIARHQRPVFSIERASLAAFYEVAHEYDLKSLPTYKAPVVLDIGANAGVFAWMALATWPDASILCYEPHPDTFDLLRKNMEGLNVKVFKAAVARDGGSSHLYEGARNRMCCALSDMEDQDMEVSWPVSVTSASSLPPCDVLKCDTEGTEIEIFESYPHLGSLKAVLVECHGDEPLNKVLAICLANGLTLLDRRMNTWRFIR